jgi:hypothetical protein
MFSGWQNQMGQDHSWAEVEGLRVCQKTSVAFISADFFACSQK